MNFPIKGFQKISMIDYPGKMCSVVFFADCNFRCPYCQNPDLITKKLPDIDTKMIFRYLKSRKKWIDGICLTGGEPALHRELPEFCKKLKAKGLLVKLDTNGTNPDMIKLLLKKKLVDYLAMDIKGPLEHYDEIAKVPVSRDNIQKSVDLIRNSGLDYEFRSTILPKLIRKKDLRSIGLWLKDSRLYVLQQFRPMITLDKSYENATSYSEEEMKRFGKMMEPFFETVEVRV